MRLRAILTVALVAGVHVLVAEVVPIKAQSQPVKAGATKPAAPTHDPVQKAHAKVLIRNPDGAVWEVRPGVAAVDDKCERPAGFAGIKAGTFGGRCTYLTCRWLTDLAECIENVLDDVVGNECDEEDYKRIKATQDEATLACSSLVK